MFYDKHAMIYQTPTEPEGEAIIREVLIAPQLDAIEDGEKIYSAYCNVEFLSEKGSIYQRWVSSASFICEYCDKPQRSPNFAYHVCAGRKTKHPK